MTGTLIKSLEIDGKKLSLIWFALINLRLFSLCLSHVIVFDTIFFAAAAAKEHIQISLSLMSFIHNPMLQKYFITL
jgi:hypothetical protein